MEVLDCACAAVVNSILVSSQKVVQNCSQLFRKRKRKSVQLSDQALTGMLFIEVSASTAACVPNVKAASSHVKDAALESHIFARWFACKVQRSAVAAVLL